MCSNFCHEHTELCRSGGNPPVSRSPEKESGTAHTLKILQEKTGCQTPQECSTYCREHKDVCQAIMRESAPPQSPGTATPTSPTEYEMESP